MIAEIDGVLQVVIISIFFLIAVGGNYFVKKALSVYRKGPSPLSVNYHFTRQCNYSCGFCFHTAKTSFVLPIQEAKRGLKMLKDAGMCIQ